MQCLRFVIELLNKMSRTRKQCCCLSERLCKNGDEGRSLATTKTRDLMAEKRPVLLERIIQKGYFFLLTESISLLLTGRSSLLLTGRIPLLLAGRTSFLLVGRIPLLNFGRKPAHHTGTGSDILPVWRNWHGERRGRYVWVC